MSIVLLVHHTTSPALQELLEAAIQGASTDELDGVQLVVRPALGATVTDVLEADGFILGTPVNIGYMSGALKHFFDQIFYPTLQAKAGAPYGAYLHGNNDAAGAVRAIESIASGLSWTKAAAPVISTGPIDKAVREQVWEMAATVAAHAAGLI